MSGTIAFKLASQHRWISNFNMYTVYIFLHHNRTAENLSLLQATFKHSPYSHEDNDI